MRAPRSTLALLLASQFVVVLDVTIVNVVLTPIQRDLGLSAASLHWVMGAYALAFGGFLLVGGRLADVAGPRPLFVTGMLLFTVASLACALAPTGSMLVSARAAQGLGAALLEPAALALLVATFPTGAARTRALALWGSAGSLGAVSGLLVGGVLTDLAGWRAIFLVNVPVGILATMVAPRLFTPGALRSIREVDVVSAALATAALASFSVAIAQTPADGLVSTTTLTALVLALAALLGVAHRRTRVAVPLVPVGFLRSTGALGPAAIGFFMGAAMLATLMLLSIYLQHSLGFSAVETGLAMLAMRVTQVGFARLTGRLVDHLGPKAVQTLGMAGMTAATMLLTRLPETGSYPLHVLPALLLMGVSAPLVFVSASVAALDCVRSAEAGLASGILRTTQWTGGALGVAAVSSTLVGAGPDALGDAIAHAFAVDAAIAAVGFGVASVLLARGPRACTVTAKPANRRSQPA